MKRILLILLVCLFQNFISAATITSTATGGNWNSTSSWIGGVVPTASDDVVIASGATIIVDGSRDAKSLDIRGTLMFNSNNTNVNLPANGTINIVSPGGVENSGPCSNNRQIRVGGTQYAACNGGGPSVFSFTDLNNAGGNCPSSAGIISGNQYICSYGSKTTTFTSTVPGGSWSSSNTAVATVNAATGLVTSKDNASGTATITYSIGGSGACPLYTASRTVYVANGPATSLGPIYYNGTPYTNTPNPPLNLCKGSTSLTFTIAGIPNVSGYVWKGSDSSWIITPSADGLSAQVTFPNNANSGNIEVYARNGCTDYGMQSYIWLTLNTPSVSAPTITSQPSTTAQTVCLNGTANPLSVNATGSSNYTYQWYSNTTASNSGGILISGATSQSYTPKTNTVGKLYYYCVISGACSPTVTSAVSGLVTVNGAPSTPGAITQPTTKCANSTGNVFSIAPVTGATSYTWSVTGAGWAITSGATTTSATITIGSGVGTVSVTATSACGTSAASTTGNITSNASLPASISIAASPSGAICSGTSVTFSATATNGGTAPAYQWKVNGNNVGTNSATFTTTTLANNDIVTVVMTSNASPCLTGSPTTSNAVTMIVNPIPSVPTIGTVTNITCTTNTGSVVLNNLPSGTWVLNSNGTPVASGTGGSYTLSGLVAGTYTFTVSQGSCTSAASLPVVINEVANIWDGTKWSKTGNGTLPTADDKIIFEGNYTVTNDLTGCSCTVNSGNVTVSSGKTLTITNAVNVNGGTLTFENNASLIQSANVTNMGEITYKRTTAAMKNFDFTYWSSPVSGQTFVALSPNTLSDKYMSYSSTGWKSEAPSSVMKPGFGYIIRTPKAGLWPNGEQVSFPYYQSVKFVGVPNNGDIPGQTVATGYFYLIGNPYPSAISADDFLFDNANNNSILNGTIYFWTHNTAIQQSGSQYIYKSDDYASYNRTGGVTATSGGQEPSGYIAAGQSFFASAKNAGTVAFTNDMRIGGENTQFFKPAKTGKSAKIERNRLWLNMTNTGGAYKQTLIGYISGASNDFDQDFDGVSFDGNSFIDFYSINNAKKLTIQGRALPFIEADMVPLGYRTTLEGDFTISINKADGKLSAQQVFLEDKELNVVHELSAADYTFTTKKGTFNERFVIKYTNRTLGNDTFEKLDENVAVIVQNKIIRIQSVDENIEKVYVYNLLGQQLHIEEKVADSQLSIDASSMSHQVVLVKILLQNGKQVTRKTILK
jgi:hypothetical protein